MSCRGAQALWVSPRRTQACVFATGANFKSERNLELHQRHSCSFDPSKRGPVIRGFNLGSNSGGTEIESHVETQVEN